ncbi:arginine--tRNA ligase [bacterium]|nr:arginine--tRNA ligase [bacterium]
MKYIKQRILELLNQAVKELQQEGVLPAEVPMAPGLARPAAAVHGDYATNLAMQWAKPARQAPRVIAQALAAKLQDYPELLAGVEIAGPGFVNLRLNPAVLQAELENIRSAGFAYGVSDWGVGRKVLLEYVSANPTGPLNIVSARAAAIGDSLARILKSQGLEVCREYYVNNAGRQIQLLGRSLYARWQESRGEVVDFPEDGYQGEYVKELAAGIAAERENSWEQLDKDTVSKVFAEQGVNRIIASHCRDLSDLGADFDNWFHELDLHVSGEIEAVLEELKTRGYLYKKEGALWFRSTDLGDDKDRVLRKANGDWAYLAADIAYHWNKLKRGYTELVDLWGPDHHGYIARLRAALQVLGCAPKAFKVHIVQQVNLWEGGKPVAMSKRAGRLVTVTDLLQDVGNDVARFFFLMRSTDSHLDFDLDLARRHTEDNPVFYIQYAHARICSILKKSSADGFDLPAVGEPVKAVEVSLPEETTLARELAAFPEVLETCVHTLEPHSLAFALRDIAAAFHRFYTVCRVLNSADIPCSRARLALIDAARVVLHNGLSLLGISAPESM